MQKFPKVGVGVMIFNKHQQILLGMRKSSHGNGSWGPPGGHLEFGESFEDCAKREVFEETGLIVDDVSLIGLTNDVFDKEQKHYVSIFMQAYFPNNQAVCNKEKCKTSEWLWFDTKNLPSPLFQPLENFLNKKKHDLTGLHTQK